MSQILLTAHNIAHKFDYELFSNVNFELKEQESIAIVGRSGSGKSTLLHIFSTFIQPNEGKVTLLEQELYPTYTSDSYTDKIEQMRRYDLGIIFQAHYLFKGMSALMNIEIATLLSEEQIDEKLLERLEIKELMSQKIGELSGGQQQRVSIARVLSKKPKVIFADEPTGNLDKETAQLVMDVLLEYVNEYHAGLILVTHDEEMAKLCSKAYRLEQKKLSKLQ
jgi:putative ABC transport system ATP-binding protein